MPPSPKTACTACAAVGPASALRCARCGELVDLEWVGPESRGDALRARFEARRGGRGRLDRSGVWRFRELVAPGILPEHVVSLGEGNTTLYESAALGRFVGLDRPLYLKHEGLNPTGSFKDRGMTTGVSAAVAAGSRAVACASTGNTSASMAAYAAEAGLTAIVFIPEGKIAFGKLAQALAYGAKVLQIQGGFDEAMHLVEAAAADLGIYLLNSVNPWRIEGQKAIPLEILCDLAWEAPDWIALPAGNLGNTSAFGKGLREAIAAGLIDRAPRLLPVQAAGAAPFFRQVRDGAAALAPEPRPETLATAIRIGNPRSWRKALRALAETDGRVYEATDREILAAKAAIDRAGIGCEPASAASVAGVRKAVAAGLVARSARVVCVLTGSLLKDPGLTVEYHTGSMDPALVADPGTQNPPRPAPADPSALRDLLVGLIGSA